MYAAGFNHFYQELWKRCKTCVYCNVKKKLVELQNQFLFRLIFNGTIFLNKFAYHNDVPITEEKKNLYNITSQLHEVLWLNETSVVIFRMKSAQCMNICHFFKVDELLKLRTDSEYSLLNTKKVSCCIYFCAMINFLMNHRRKYVSSSFFSILPLFKASFTLSLQILFNYFFDQEKGDFRPSCTDEN